MDKKFKNQYLQICPVCKYFCFGIEGKLRPDFFVGLLTKGGAYTILFIAG